MKQTPFYFKILIAFLLLILNINFTYGIPTDSDNSRASLADIIRPIREQIKCRGEGIILSIPVCKQEELQEMAAKVTYYLTGSFRNRLKTFICELNTKYIESLLQIEDINKIDFRINGRSYSYSSWFKDSGDEYVYKSYQHYFTKKKTYGKKPQFSKQLKKNLNTLDKYYNWIGFCRRIYQKNNNLVPLKDFWLNYLNRRKESMIVIGELYHEKRNETATLTFYAAFKGGYLNLEFPSYDIDVMQEGGSINYEKLDEEISEHVNDFMTRIETYFEN